MPDVHLLVDDGQKTFSFAVKSVCACHVRETVQNTHPTHRPGNKAITHDSTYMYQLRNLLFLIQFLCCKHFLQHRYVCIVVKRIFHTLFICHIHFSL